jgi:hypothetical protein
VNVDRISELDLEGKNVPRIPHTLVLLVKRHRVNGTGANKQFLENEMLHRVDIGDKDSTEDDELGTSKIEVYQVK